MQFYQAISSCLIFLHCVNPTPTSSNCSSNSVYFASFNLSMSFSLHGNVESWCHPWHFLKCQSEHAISLLILSNDPSPLLRCSLTLGWPQCCTLAGPCLFKGLTLGFCHASHLVGLTPCSQAPLNFLTRPQSWPIINADSQQNDFIHLPAHKLKDLTTTIVSHSSRSHPWDDPSSS